MLNMDPAGSSDDDDRRMGMGAFAAVEDWDDRILEDLNGKPVGELHAQIDLRNVERHRNDKAPSRCRRSSDG